MKKQKQRLTSPSLYQTCSGWAACQNPIWKHISLDDNCFLTDCKTWNPKILWRAPYRQHCTTRLHKSPPSVGCPLLLIWKKTPQTSLSTCFQVSEKKLDMLNKENRSIFLDRSNLCSGRLQAVVTACICQPNLQFCSRKKSIGIQLT